MPRNRVRLDHGAPFPGSLSAVKRRVLRLKASADVQAEDVAIPVETAPGQVAQVDFGYAGYLHDPETGQARKAWVFVMVLGYSRHQFSRLVFDQKTETWLRLITKTEVRRSRKTRLPIGPDHRRPDPLDQALLGGPEMRNRLAEP